VHQVGKKDYHHLSIVVCVLDSLNETTEPGSSTCGPPGCIMLPTATCVNFVCSRKKSQYFTPLGIPCIFSSPRVAREVYHNRGCGRLL